MNAVLKFAREELDRYCSRIFGEENSCNIAFELRGKGENPFRDGYAIDIRGGAGKIIANNERSILLGVYKALQQIGCRFIRPGKSGEKIPRLSVRDFQVSYVFEPANDHRGITIEGAVSEEDLKALIDWLPKVGMNSYFIQFRNGYEFYERWYTHPNNPLLPPEKFDWARAQSIHGRIVSEIKKRGLILHGVGHGWTCECLGISSTGWQKRSDVPESIRPYLAEVKGERKFFKDTPLNTQLCYSNPAVRKMLVEEVDRYAAAHPEIDVLHFWPADDFNNVCECAECKKSLPSDLYVELLNEIDAALTAAGLPTKIAFLIYLDVYWPPEREKIRNQSRFIMMFAPIFRSYSESYDECLQGGACEPLPYRRNEVAYPHDVSVYLGFLRGWKRCFSGDCFDFDYHLMWDIYRDFSGLTLASILRRDISVFPELGLNGLISCQVQRCFYPSPLAMHVMADSLSEPIEDFDAYCDGFFADAYGPYAESAKGIFRTVQDNVPFDYFRERIPLGDASALQGFRRAEEYLRAAKEPLQGALREELEPYLREGLEQLVFYIDTLLLLLPCCIAKGEKRPQSEVMSLYKRLHDYVNENEMRMRGALDAFYFHFIVSGFLEKGEMVNYGGI